MVLRLCRPISAAAEGQVVVLTRPFSSSSLPFVLFVRSRGGTASSRRALLLFGILVVAVLVLVSWAGPAGAAPPFTVNSTLDEPDAVLDGNCVSMPSGKCTLRAAIQEINNSGTGTVNVPAGVYVLTRNVVGTDDGSVGDLDIGLNPANALQSKSATVTVIGAGADQTIIDGNGAHRVIDI